LTAGDLVLTSIMLKEFQALLNSLYVGCPIDGDRTSGLQGYRSAVSNTVGLRAVFHYLDDITSEAGAASIEQIILQPVSGDYFRVYFLTKPNTANDIPI